MPTSESAGSSDSARPLLEREAELERIGLLGAEVRRGRGRHVLVEGEPGAGKTRLLEAAIEHAGMDGLQVLRARGAELETTFAFGVARQLLAPALERMPRSERERLLAGGARLARPVLEDGAAAPAAPKDPRFPLVSGLASLVAEMAASAPLALVVDDLQWSDEPSLHWLRYLMERLDRIAALVLCGVRTGDPATDAPPVAALRLRLEAEALEPSPLSADAVGRLVGAALGAPAHPAFAAACHEQTGGNPFLVEELSRALAEAGISPTRDAVPAVPSVRPAGVARSVQGRLIQAGAAALRLAEAVAVLGSGCELRHAARLAGLDGDEALRAVDELAAADILQAGAPPSYTHPLVGAAVYEAIARGRRAGLHGEAARILGEEPARDDAVAAHLLETEAAEDPWVVERLLPAASGAAARAGPHSAVRYLRRALAEPPPPETAAQVLLALGEAEARAHEVEPAATHLRAALAADLAPPDRARAAIELSLALGRSGRIDEGLAELDREATAVAAQGGELHLTLEGAYAGFAFLRAPAAAMLPSRVERYAQLAGRTRGERELLAVVARARTFLGRPAGESLPLAARALGSGRLLGDEGLTLTAWGAIVSTFTLAEELDTAERAIDAALEETRAEAAVFELGFALHVAATLALRRGRVEEAERHAREGTALVAEHGLFENMPMLAGHLVNALTERLALREARETLEGFGLAGDLPEHYFAIPPLTARARLERAEGRVDQAAASLAEAGRLYLAHAVEFPVQPWRTELALLLPDAQRERADELVGAELELARRFAAPGPIGTALRAQGMLADGARAEELLEESVEILRRSIQRLELARSLLELGAVRRRQGHAAAAREPLREAIVIAHECGSTATAVRAEEELAATGARRLNRVHLSGPEALTPSELRAARMAASGMSNPQIARSLFVSPKTVETHLRSAFRKLGVSSRGELAGQLDPAGHPEPVPGARPAASLGPARTSGEVDARQGP